MSLIWVYMHEVVESLTNMWNSEEKYSVEFKQLEWAADVKCQSCRIQQP